MTKLNVFHRAVLAALLVLPAGVFASEADVLVTKLPSADGGKLVFEFVNSANVAGLQFDVTLAGVGQNQVSFGSCTSDLPSNTMAACNMLDNAFRVAIIGGNLSAVPTGPIGSIDLQGVDLASLDVQVTNVKMSDPDGNPVSGGALVDQRSASEWRSMERTK